MPNHNASPDAAEDALFLRFSPDHFVYNSSIGLDYLNNLGGDRKSVV